MIGGSLLQTTLGSFDSNEIGAKNSLTQLSKNTFDAERSLH